MPHGNPNGTKGSQGMYSYWHIFSKTSSPHHFAPISALMSQHCILINEFRYNLKEIGGRSDGD